MKVKRILSLLFTFCLTFSVGYSAYLIIDKVFNDTIKEQENNNDYKRVEFNYNGTFPIKGNDGVSTTTSFKEVYYVKSNEVITLEDTPGYLLENNNTSNGYVNWVSNSGTLGIETKNSITVTSDLIFEGEANVLVDASGNVSRTELNSESGVFDTNTDISYGSNTANINQNDSSMSKEVTINEPILSGVQINSNIKDQDGNQTTSQDLTESSGGFLGIGANYKDYQYTTDTTIGLEDNLDLKSEYKPKAGGSSSTNECSTRVTLSQDTYLFGNTNLEIGARTGYYNGSGWSQINYQNFINGSYSELDLKGHKLVVGAGCTLKAVGSIIDSVGGGEIIIDNGGLIEATMVIEDQHHETSMPIAYAMGAMPFRMFRMPYLNAKLRLNKGATLKGIVNIDFGGDSNNDMLSNARFNIIGNGNDFIFNTEQSPDNAYIERTPLYDSQMINDSTIQSNSEVVNNIVYQKFDYRFYNCNISVNMQKWPGLKIKGIRIDVDFSRGSFIVPTYFRFYSYNSSFKISNNITFLPGTYVYIDKNSKIVLSNFSMQSFNVDSTASDYFASDYFQGVGGLNFINEKFDFTENYKNGSKGLIEYGWTDDGDNNSTSNYNGSTSNIFSKTSSFWTYVNKYYPSHADIEGTFEFQTNGDKYVEFSLGGEINIKNVEDFKYKVNTRDDVRLMNASVDSSTNHLKAALLSMNRRVKFNIADYYVYPLVSNGNVLMDLTNPNKVRDDYLYNEVSYDFKNGIISTTSSEVYAIIFSKQDGSSFTYNSSATHLNNIGYASSSNRYNQQNDLDINVFQLDSFANNIATVSTSTLNSSSGQFIYFHGSFFQYSNGEVDISKFRARDSKYPDDGRSTRKVAYQDNVGYYGHGAWRLS